MKYNYVPIEFCEQYLGGKELWPYDIFSKIMDSHIPIEHFTMDVIGCNVKDELPVPGIESLISEFHQGAEEITIVYDFEGKHWSCRIIIIEDVDLKTLGYILNGSLNAFL